MIPNWEKMKQGQRWEGNGSLSNVENTAEVFTLPSLDLDDRQKV